MSNNMIKQPVSSLDHMSPQELHGILLKSFEFNDKASLTSRELQILRLIAEGFSYEEIASQLTLTYGTVKWYMTEIYSKMGVNSRRHAVKRALELKLFA